MTLILGFSGRARHGKSEACEAIAKYVATEVWRPKTGELCTCHTPGIACQRRATATIYDIGNFVRLYCIGKGRLPAVERKDMTKEQLQVLIDVGKEKRAEDPDYWLKPMFTAIGADQPDVALIPNLRYWNEVDAVKRANGYVVRVTRMTGTGADFISPDRNPNDVSETSLYHCWETDFYITVKDGHAELVRKQAVAIYQYLSECGRYA